MWRWRPDASGRWRVFLHSWCDAGLCGYYFILALAKTVTPGGSPRREPGWPVPSATLLTFLNQEILAAQKPMPYTDLLAAGGVFKCDQKRFRCHDWYRTFLVVFNISCDYAVYFFLFLSCKILNGILKVFKIRGKRRLDNITINFQNIYQFR